MIPSYIIPVDVCIFSYVTVFKTCTRKSCLSEIKIIGELYVLCFYSLLSSFTFFFAFESNLVTQLFAWPKILAFRNLVFVVS